MEKLGLDWKLLLAQIINFILFFYLYKRFIAGPLMRFIKKEKDTEQEKEKILAELEKKREIMDKDQRAFEEKTQKESAIILDKVRREGEKIRKEILEKAKKDADEIKIRGKRIIQEERETMYTDLKKKLVTLSISLINQELKDYLSEKMRKEVTVSLLKNTPRQKLIIKNEN